MIEQNSVHIYVYSDNTLTWKPVYESIQGHLLPLDDVTLVSNDLLQRLSHLLDECTDVVLWSILNSLWLVYRHPNTGT